MWVLVVLLAAVGTGDAQQVNYAQQLQRVLSQRNYSAVIPSQIPIVDTANLYVENCRDVSSTAVMDIYLRESWVDPRLVNWSHPDNSFFSKHPKLSGPEQTGMLWRPDTYFFLTRSETNHLTEYVWVFNNGTVLKSQMVTVEVPCELKVEIFPFDTIKCTISVSSYSYVVEELIYAWDKVFAPIYFDPEVTLTDQNIFLERIEPREELQAYQLGDFSALKAYFYFKRDLSPFFVQVYIPAAMVVVLSWIGFWINRDATPARASIGITTVLTMLTLASTTNYSRDETIIQATTACDMYVWFCFGFVICAMVEFALSDYYNKPRFAGGRSRGRRHTRSADDTYHADNNDGVEPCSVSRQVEQEPKFNEFPPDNNFSTPLDNGGPGVRSRRVKLPPTLTSRMTFVSQKRLPPKMDLAARVIFPMAFGFFNILYWTIVVIKI